MQTIDLTPTWAGLMPGLIEVAANGTSHEGRKNAKAELMRLAKIVDDMPRGTLNREQLSQIERTLAEVTECLNGRMATTINTFKLIAEARRNVTTAIDGVER